MAETAMSLAGQHVLPKFLEAVNMLRNLPKEVADITDELESFQDFINAAEEAAEAEEYKNRRDRMKKRLMRLREAAFCMEDVIDEYVILCEEKQQHDDPGCPALLCEAVDFIKNHILRLQIAYKIQDAKSLVRDEKDGFQSHFPLEQRPENSRGNQNVTWHKLRMDPLFIQEDEVVGFEGPMVILKNWLTEGQQQRTVISVVGMAGLGKTTLAKQVFDKVHNEFECHALITVSQSYTVEGLLRDMMNKLCKEKMENPPYDVSSMDRMSLIEEVRNRLHNKRYVVLFDDVWTETFWDDIELALIDDKNGSRVLITTRLEKVSEFCKKSSLVEVHMLQPLSKEKSLELLCKKAFGYGFDGCCPKEYEDVGLKIVIKCGCFPLAIVAIGGLLNRKCKTVLEWQQFSQNPSFELERNSELNSVTKILSLSYDDLSYNLRSCLLYFGMYPEDYEVKSGRLIRQWIAEGFVKHEPGKTLEEAAEQYLKELITRSLVQVSSVTTDGKVRGCRVHDSIHEMIIGKMKDTCFYEYIDEHNPMVSSEIVRRLTIAKASNDLIGGIKRPYIRSILIFINAESSAHFISGILAKYMPLKVLDFESAPLFHVPENLGNFMHLKYLSFRFTKIESLPKSVGKLLNLETLDIRQTNVSEIPKEISKLRKLRHLLANQMSSIVAKQSLGSMISLQKIPPIPLDDEVVIRELGKLKKLRGLIITSFKEELGNALCSSINEMQFLEKLHIDSVDNNEVIDLHFMSTPSALGKLSLNGKLKKFPNWIPPLQNLVKLCLNNSQLTNDPLESIKDMPNLLVLSMNSEAYEGETLHFENGGFQKLQELELEELYNLNSIVIGRGALHSLKKLQLNEIPRLKRLPFGIQHLKKLEVFNISNMPFEFEVKIGPEGEEFWMIEHVPHVNVKASPIFGRYLMLRIPSF
ncbi:hypothetical protein VNO78_27675 [Psophocarpus tetragonolobus]|uniref:Disease resistance protein RPM1 n=1 Tax=Psophocarpus tetragonolobus TaxID=3891 RepID=A0AAN9S1E3_PSOTE